MKRVVVFLLSLFSFTLCVNADSISNIDMKVYIDYTGNANITETWKVKADSGTEWYKSIPNLGNSKITDFKVSMDGYSLTSKNWNINENIDQKAGFYGTITSKDKIELCFGKLDYKNHEFTLNYTITNFIFNTNDAQVLYWTLVEKTFVNSVNIEVSSFFPITKDFQKWLYGFDGKYNVIDNKLIITNDTPLRNEYIALLMRFDLKTFSINNVKEEYNDFASVFNASNYEDDNNHNNYEILFGKVPTQKKSVINTDDYFGILFFLATGFVLICSIITYSKNYKTQKITLSTDNYPYVPSNNYSNYGYKYDIIISYNNLNYFRDIPCNKDIYYANILLKLNNKYYNKSNIIGAIILKWVKENKIIFQKETTFVKNQDICSIGLKQRGRFTDNNEKELFEMLYEASHDGKLIAFEFEKWCETNSEKYLNLLTNIETEQIAKLKEQNHIYKRENLSDCSKMSILDDTILKDSKQLYGLKLFLEDFSSINTKEVIDVKIWDEYLMFAYLFGIADKVSKQLEKLYPELKENIYFNSRFYNFMSTLMTVNENRYDSKSTLATINNDYHSRHSSYSGFGSSGHSSKSGGHSSGGNGGSQGGR